MRKAQDIPSVINCHSCDGVYEGWQYFCTVMQLITMVIIAVLMVVMIFGGVNIQIMVNTGSTSSPSSPVHAHLSNIADLQDSEIANLFSGSTNGMPNSTVVQKVFDYYDGNGDECINYAEFSEFVADSLQCKEQFALMDISDDGELQYAELVFVFTVLETIPLVTSSEVTDVLKEIFGDEYSDEHEPEFLAALFFEEMDVEQQNVITLSAYTQYEIDQEWNEFNPNEDECVSFDEFYALFPESVFYQTLQEFETEASNGDFDVEEIIGAIQDAQQEDIEAMDLLFEPHQFDGPGRRRSMLVGAIVVGILLGMTAVLAAVEGYQQNKDNDCFGENELVKVMGDTFKPLKDLKIGDYVFDGSEFSKIFYIYKPLKSEKLKMNKIRFGNRKNDNSLTLTPSHLLYREGEFKPIASGDIKVGDTLHGIDNTTDYIYDMYFGNGYDYMVYDISKEYASGIAPITMSGDLMVNGVKASSYSISVCEHDDCHDAGMVFRWISDHVNEQMAANMIDFFHYRFQQQADGQVELMGNGAVLSVLLGAFAIPLFLVCVAGKKMFRRFIATSKKKTD